MTEKFAAKLNRADSETGRRIPACMAMCWIEEE
jgi:hypothetical protein